MAGREQAIEKPIFIVGVNKSGTSLLYLALSRHPELSAIRSFKSRAGSGAARAVGPKQGRAMLLMSEYGIGEGQKIPGLIEKLAPKSGSGRWATREFQDTYRLTEADVEAGDREAVALAYRGAMVDPSLRLCEKSPPNLIRMRYLQTLFPDSCFVIIVRDAFANIAANAKKREKWGDVELQAEHWAEAHRLMLEDIPLLGRYLKVTYECLIEVPQEVLGQILEFCNLSQRPDLAASIPIIGGVNEQMRQLLSHSEANLIEGRCGQVIRAVNSKMPNFDSS